MYAIRSYYDMLNRMMEANLKNNAGPLLEVKQMLVDLRSTWAEAIDDNKQKMRQQSTRVEPVATGVTYRPLASAM